MPAKPPCKKQKCTPVVVESDEERPDIDTDDVTSASDTEEERGNTVRREGYQEAEEAQYWNAHGRECVEIDCLTVDPAVNAYTGITELKGY